MKELTVRYFAIFREATGRETESITTEAGTAAELFTELTERNSELQHYAAALVAVNDAMVDWETPLEDGDEVLFFPPVAGG